MKKIILAIALSSFLPALAVAKDKAMHNDNPNASAMTGKHMMNSNPNASVMKGKHMMSDNPFASHPKDAARMANTNDQVKKGYRIIKYKK